jgi:hypothetical protein
MKYVVYAYKSGINGKTYSSKSNARRAIRRVRKKEFTPGVYWIMLYEGHLPHSGTKPIQEDRIQCR